MKDAAVKEGDGCPECGDVELMADEAIHGACTGCLEKLS